jgi:hypothetical protein
LNKIIFLVVLVFLGNCSVPAVSPPVQNNKNKEVNQPTVTVTITPVPTSVPTNGIQPTALPSPSATPVPTPIATTTTVPSPQNSLKDINFKFISLHFKEDYRVRFDKEKKEFFSRTGADTSSVNNLFKEYNVTEIYDDLQSQTEEQADALYEEELNTPWGSTWVPPSNSASSFTIAVNVEIFKEFTEKLRKEPLVREVGENAETGV